ncbi:hypothetical protein [Stieleria mannarensis]|uniref:hypothetical protein n=1 Tax=Stieleria mannarensis TaxID=2755585 RepID=UPI001602B502|nr:hypothetical protein [Rhodopirellula sp. JC639]
MNVRKTELLRKTAATLFVAAGSIAISGGAGAQAPSGELHKDPVTGDIYRTVTQRITRPVVEDRIEKQQTVVHRPETVTEIRPEVRTSYSPVTQMRWMPYVEGRWNPFRQPTVAYRQVPETRWEARSEVVNRATTQTRWVAETRTVDVPKRTVRYETTEQKGLELVARAMPQPRVGSNVAPEIAARLQPISTTTDGTYATQPVTAIASNTVGRSTSEPPLRSSTQSGMRTNVLQPASSMTTPMPTTAGAVIATVPSFSVYR